MVDIELGVSGSTPPPATNRLLWRLLWKINSFRFSWRSLKSRLISHGEKRDEDRISQPQIEDFRKGYPRFSALIAAHGAFHIFRRFSHVRTRLLLLAQDKIVHLEERLLRIDQAERAPLFLSSSGEDRNVERQEVLSELGTSLEEYDRLIERSQRMFAYESPHKQYVTSLQRWIRGNSCIAKNEARFLDKGDELLTLSPIEDGAVSWLEQKFCDTLVTIFKGTSIQKSRDPHVHIFSQSSTIKLARGLLSPLIAVLLLVPVVVCSSIKSLAASLVITVIATSVFICCLSLLTKAKTIDLAVAGATYTTVLVVFTAGPNKVSN